MLIVRRLKARPGHASAGLSRVQFLGGAAALLAGCGVQRSVLPSGHGLPGSTGSDEASRSSLNLTAAQLPKQTKRKNGIILSTNKTGSAIAAHDSHGNFVMSIALGPAFIRGRAQDGTTIVMPTMAPSPPKLGQPISLEAGPILRFTKSRTKQQVQLHIVNAKGPKALRVRKHSFILEANGSVTFLHGRKRGKKRPVGNTGAPLKITSQAELDALVAYTIDRPGAWTLDDDFVGTPGAYPANVGLANRSFAHAVYRRSKAGKRKAAGKIIVDSTSGTSAGSGGSSAVVSSSSCTTSTSSSSSTSTSSSTVSYNSSSFGSSGYYGGSGRGGANVSRNAEIKAKAAASLRGVESNAHTALCIWDMAKIVAAVIGVLGGLAALGITCNPAGILATLGGACAMAILSFAFTYMGYLETFQNYVDNQCPGYQYY